MEDMFQVGVIASTHGLKGEVKVFPTTDDSSRFTELKNLYLEPQPGAQLIPVTVRSVKFFKKYVILGFKEYADINDIEQYRGARILVTREDAAPLDENEYYIADMIGLQVYLDDGSHYGELTDVLKTGANDVYEIMKENGNEVLIPAIRECVLSIDIEYKKMVIHLLEGLDT